MKYPGKALTLLLTLALMMTSVLLVESASSQSTAKPSTPQFTLKLVDDSYDVPPTSTVNPYTGKTETSGGYHVQGYLEIYIKIKNQPFTKHIDSSKTAEQQTSVFYQVQTKGHYSKDWSTIEQYVKEAPAFNPRNPYQEQDYNAEYTILRYYNSGNLPREGQLDIRVRP
jgi:hypothetical protein